MNSGINCVLQARIKDEDPAVRATVVSAIRYTFTDTSPAFDELLLPLINDFLSLIQDPDLVSLLLIFDNDCNLINFLVFFVECSASGVVDAQLCRSYKATNYQRSAPVDIA
jgi:hypothetical protein